MSRIPYPKKSRIGFITVALVGGMNLAPAAFAVEALPQGYQLAAVEKVSEGKCGEGKCGSSEASTKVSKAEGKCGEGKCGEGSCGDASFARTDTNGDYLVSRQEFLAVAPTRAEVFDIIDTNRDGFLSEAETYQYMKKVYKSNGKDIPQELFTRLSKAKD
ncbi:hypothetical protein QE250_12375 [Chromatiaceae bacterium AAb-1]|nr:hypothetical protein [Chromatiaceae bacterium AAb-1]